MQLNNKADMPLISVLMACKRKLWYTAINIINILWETTKISSNCSNNTVVLFCENLCGCLGFVIKVNIFPQQVIEKRYFTRDPSQVSRVCIDKPQMTLIVSVGLFKWRDSFVMFAPLALQMPGFTDRKRFNFKTLHYDWAAIWRRLTIVHTEETTTLTRLLSPPSSDLLLTFFFFQPKPLF